MQVRPRPTARLIQIAPLIKPGDRGNKHHPSGQYINAVRLAWERPAPTLIANAFSSSSLVLHPDYDAAISIDEAKRLHSVADEFVLLGHYRQRWSLIGRSVPPLMMRAVAVDVRDRFLRGTARASVLPVRPLTRNWSRQTTKSPLRYPGGKSRAVRYLLPLLPSQPGILVSPFLGGASAELGAAALGWKVRGYDANGPLIDFWRVLLKDARALAAAVEEYLPLSRALYYELQGVVLGSQLGRAAAYFVRNRASFSGLAYSGGMSRADRFTRSSIEGLRNFRARNLTVEWADFRESIPAHPDAVLLLDPPYFNSSRLYGERGDLHASFDHTALRDLVRQRERWILRYDDCSEIRAMYDGYTILPLRWKYGMSRDTDGREIVILSHDLAELRCRQRW